MSWEGALKAAAEHLVAQLNDRGVAAYLGEDAAQGVWRISPDAEWPAWARAQWWLAVDESGTASVGLVIHKGLDPAARLYYAEVPMIMERGWAWSRTWGTPAPGPFWQALADAAATEGLEVELAVHNGLVPGFHPWTGPFRHQFAWRWNAQGLAPAHAVWDFGTMAAVASAPDLPTAISRLSESPDWRWLWVRAWAGWRWPAPDRPSQGQRWAEAVLWPRVEGWLPWYQAGP
ncbi:MAG: hypothetical protein K6U14_11660 [Firmicutes bacterium]|nr:hypothetical protein [Alicyclobacillaceae bacterium]MCL6498270.1 hypothetical protein [Bacillota bacterium]